MMRSTQLAGFVVLLALAAAPPARAASSSVSGVVRDSAGAPQIGAEVELLRPDLSVVTSVYTNSEGRFLITTLLPGRYALKAMGPSFLPSMRENVKVRGETIVNLTLNTLYEVIQWLPADPRAGNAQKDDWEWTLRSAANRPLLRWLEDGPLVVVSDGSGATPKLKARLMATGQEGAFGESGERISVSVEDTPVDSRTLLARVDFAPGTDAGMESMLGFNQDLGYAGSVQSLAAVSIQPGVGEQGLDEASVNSSEIMHFGDMADAEVGASAMAARLGGDYPETITAVLPYADLAFHDGSNSFRYRMATMVRNPAMSGAQAGNWLPAISERNGSLVMEHGLHQEIGWERNTDTSALAVRLFSDDIHNPVMEAMGRFEAGEAAAIGNAALFDSASDLLRTAGPAFSTVGVEASAERRLNGDNRIRIRYASADALTMPTSKLATSFDDLIAGAHPRRAQTFAIALSGTLEGTGTHWRASYTWQADDTVTSVAPFALDSDSPFLNFHLRQPIHLSRNSSNGFEALLDVRNLLAEGYRPYILSDGSLLIFAQDQRSVQAGLAFTF